MNLGRTYYNYIPLVNEITILLLYFNQTNLNQHGDRMNFNVRLFNVRIL